MERVPLDAVNLRIIETLQKNGRTSMAEMARELRRAENSIRARVLALEEAGVIHGYRAIIDPAALGHPVHAFLQAQPPPTPHDSLADALAAIPQVTSAHLTTGERPLRIEVLARDLPHLQRLVEQRFARLGVTDLEPDLILQRLVGPRPLTVAAEPGASPIVTLLRRATTAGRGTAASTPPAPLERELVRAYA